MELRTYFRILVKNWWIIIPLTLLSLTATLLFSYAKTPVYEATATYVTKLDQALSSVDSSIYGLDMLTGRQRIFATHCQIMTSQAVRDEAYKLLGVNPIVTDLAEYTVKCSVLPETNVLAIAVQGFSPALLSHFGEAIGEAGARRANNLYHYFPLELLDAVTVNEIPVSPNYTRDAVLGGVLGLVVGISLALLTEYLRSPLQRFEAASIRNLELGTYNARYFEQRMTEEVNRSRNKLRPMSVALMLLQPNEDFALIPQDVQSDLLRQASLLISDALRQGDILAYRGKNVFGILLPETPSDEAEQLLSQIYEVIRSNRVRYGDYFTLFQPKIVLIESSGGSLNSSEILTKATEMLKAMESDPDSKIALVRTTPPPFALEDINATEIDLQANGAKPSITSTTEIQLR